MAINVNFNLEELRIEPLNPKYYNENLELMNSVILESHFLARINEVTKEESNGFIEHFFQLPNAIYLIAIYNNQLIGHIYAIPRVEELIRHIVYIGYLVKDSYRNKGICSRLIENLIEKAREKKEIKIMVAEVAEDNNASTGLLKKYGFEEFGRIKNGFMKKNKEFLDFLYFSKHLYE
jgi:RimJ/RimL family protein N-acetyltransferase